MQAIESSEAAETLLLDDAYAALELLPGWTWNRGNFDVSFHCLSATCTEIGVMIVWPTFDSHVLFCRDPDAAEAFLPWYFRGSPGERGREYWSASAQAVYELLDVRTRLHLKGIEGRCRGIQITTEDCL